MVMGSGSAIDQDAIIDSVNVFLDRLADCVGAVRYRNTNDGGYVKTPISPRAARVTVSPGIQQQGGTFDIQWWENGDYKYHYQERGLQFRFGREADNEGTGKPVRHFHPPSDPSRHRQSCIGPDHPPERVTLAVIANWLPAVKQSDASVLNARRNPP